MPRFEFTRSAFLKKAVQKRLKNLEPDYTRFASGFSGKFCRGQVEISRACCHKSRDYNAVIGKICKMTRAISCEYRFYIMPMA